MVVMSNLPRLSLLMFSWLRNSTQAEWNLTFNITFCRTSSNARKKILSLDLNGFGLKQFFSYKTAIRWEPLSRKRDHFPFEELSENENLLKIVTEKEDNIIKVIYKTEMQMKDFVQHAKLPNLYFYVNKMHRPEIWSIVFVTNSTTHMIKSENICS